MNDHDFPSRAWPDMCAAYRNSELGQACLSLQEAFAVDVPLLLLLCLSDRAGRTISDRGLAALVGEAGAWRETVIAPLRQVRQAMKHRFVATAEAALRDEIKRLELEAERQHVARLVGGFPAIAAAADQGSARRYLATCGLTDEAATEFIEIFAAAHEAEIGRNDPGSTAPGRAA